MDKLNIIAISQVYWPDTASVSQHLTDLLNNLAVRGHDVTVITSQNNYENPLIKYSRYEYKNNVKIIRISNTGFGKQRKIFRLLDFLSYNFLLIFKLLSLSRKGSVLLGLTSPPLISYLGILISKFKGMKFVYWTMDLQPELSIATGYLKTNSIAAKVLQKLGDYIFKHANAIIVLDRFMKSHIYNRVGRYLNINIVPVWPVMNEVYDGPKTDNIFSLEHGFGNKIVIMYSGNHSVVHPLDTLLDTAKILKNDKRFLFVHIGAGVRLNDVKQFKTANNLQNIVVLPYQPREKIHLSLGSADIQVVILGDGCVGYTHPNKIYGSMFIGKPILYIGSKSSHISDCVEELIGNISVRHGESEVLVAKLLEFSNLSEHEVAAIGQNNRNYALKHFSPKYLIDSMVSIIEST